MKLKCTCEGETVITRTEWAMADETGLAPVYIHKFMDTWAEIAERVISKER